MTDDWQHLKIKCATCPNCDHITLIFKPEDHQAAEDMGILTSHKISIRFAPLDEFMCPQCGMQLVIAHELDPEHSVFHAMLEKLWSGALDDLCEDGENIRDILDNVD